MDSARSHPTLAGYGANAAGHVFNMTKKQQMLGCVNAAGYRLTCIRACQKITFHRFVYECFHGTIPDKYDVDHIDGDKLNNSIDNLQALTRLEHRRKTVLGEISKTNTLCRPVIATKLCDGVEKEYKSMTEAANDIGISYQTIGQYLQGKRKSAKGYHFEFSNIDKIRGEYWASSLQFPGIEISSEGRIKDKRNRITRGELVNTYLIYTGKAVHHYVCTTFHGPRPSAKHTVDHINRDKSDNSVDNLRWATHEEQAQNTSYAMKIKIVDTKGVEEIFESGCAVTRKLGITHKAYRNYVKDCARLYRGYYWFLLNADTRKTITKIIDAAKIL